MSQFLKLSQFFNGNRVPEVNVRCGRVYTKLDAQRPAEFKLLLEFFFTDDFGCSSRQDIQGFFDRMRHDGRRLE